MIVYDIEIINSPIYNEKKKKYHYAKGWTDYEGMGIACLVAYKYINDDFFIWQDGDKIDDLIKYFENANLYIGYNNQTFDDNFLKMKNIDVPVYKSYDILRQIYYAKGYTDIWDKKTHGGYNLDKMFKVNLNIEEGKNGSGADAPFLWQDGKKEQIINYCKNDVRLTVELLNKIFEKGGLIDCKTKKFLKMGLPYIM